MQAAVRRYGVAVAGIFVGADVSVGNAVAVALGGGGTGVLDGTIVLVGEGTGVSVGGGAGVGGSWTEK